MNNAKKYSISKKMPKLTRIDEMKLNSTLKKFDERTFKRIISKKRPTIDNVPKMSSHPKPINNSVLKIIKSLQLSEVINPEQRAQEFLLICRANNYAPNTTSQYFNAAKQLGLFPKDYRPNLSNFTGRPHVRVISFENYAKFINYLHDNFEEYSAASMTAYYTGLRIMEILEMSLYTLYQLKQRSVYITSIERKNTSNFDKTDSNKIFWKPVYNTYFNLFINKLIQLYKNDYENFCSNKNNAMVKLNRKLFYHCQQTLLNRNAILYFRATEQLLPLGFGIHGYRTMMATILADETNNILIPQRYLQHKSVKTTEKYIHTNLLRVEKEFNRLTQKSMGHLSSILTKATEETKAIKEKE